MCTLLEQSSLKKQRCDQAKQSNQLQSWMWTIWHKVKIMFSCLPNCYATLHVAALFYVRPMQWPSSYIYQVIGHNVDQIHARQPLPSSSLPFPVHALFLLPHLASNAASLVPLKFLFSSLLDYFYFAASSSQLPASSNSLFLRKWHSEADLNAFQQAGVFGLL